MLDPIATDPNAAGASGRAAVAGPALGFPVVGMIGGGQLARMTQEAASVFSGNIYVPEDMESIQL